ncbi:E3 ubiquitin-protein ligase Midline-1-like isoform X3 [Mercenaria mercenaria]|uniref:E3 ubiquitin-protein ligase Midline-1-like isoform X3 n=1 Tax=Mercenaria mercenaria TaxID=6596 RepID=UPI00234E922F|nr:E3 ubiquitin-protein ligase Midline-1-like isoform X3 [Mercenaria mercenaria]
MDIEEIESILNCPICMEEYNDPRILPCQHSFCEKCLSSYIKDLTKAKPLKKGSFPCPICRHKTKLRNNCNDASSFERDLTKTGLLDSKHILLMQEEDSPADGSTCEAQTMSTQTDDGHDVTDLKDDPDFPTPALSGDDAKSENRKTPKRNRKRALARSAKNKDKNSSNTKKKRNKQKTNAKTDLNQGRKEKQYVWPGN